MSKIKHVAWQWYEIFEIKIILKNMECFVAKSRYPTQASSFLGDGWTMFGEIIALLKQQNKSWTATCRNFSNFVHNPV